MKQTVLILLCLFSLSRLAAENGYDLWLRYRPIEDKTLLSAYRQQITGLHVAGSSPTLQAVKEELQTGFKGLLLKNILLTGGINNGTLIVANSSDPLIAKTGLINELKQIGQEGYLIAAKLVNGKKCIIITANSDVGLLYGSFHFLRLLQTQQSIHNLSIVSFPKLKLRLLNHWDNLNRTVERGYAGFSIWNWHTLPGYIDKRYIDYARANASVGINGTVLTNVNANATILTQTYLEKVKALAEVFRPYGIKVYLTARFSAPIEIGRLKTADPLNDSVRQWWKEKAKEIYSIIPDFGGFLVKANSEGQPGPQDYKRNHADGANMLADAVSPFGGIVMWRAFVYNPESNDRFKQAYEEFQPLDGKFRKNVLVQVKNGPIDFQPREPFSPLFGAMPQTPLMMEFQLTQEYLGQGTHLVYEAPMFKEVLTADTYAKGKGSTVAKVIDGILDNHSLTGMAGVSNIGNDINWCGHPFAQANWYTLGRLSWDYNLSSEQIATEWIRQTFSNDQKTLRVIKNIMLHSHEALVNYMTPIGLTHIMYNGHHYGPMPWGNTLNRPDWNPVYYHRADSFGIGFDRTSKGTNALAQYKPEVSSLFADINKCPDDFLLWFHHASWNHPMQSGRNLWNELCYKYYTGTDSVRSFIRQWNSIEKSIDKERFGQVKQLLHIQLKDAIWWRNACLLYFQTFSKMPIPSTYEQPDKTLEYYKSIRILFAPGN
ncbi:MAG TPA: alpha-glucuronidase family glycosyl hydrolase [Chitinophagaceae bacterium]|nr:alpha-glucuronidase family glycosyl hydrolase [Chitinophagaceae bacterium]